jgi:hypothetical protein
MFIPYVDEARNVKVFVIGQEEALVVIPRVFAEDTYEDFRTWHFREHTEIPDNFVFVHEDGTDIIEEDVHVQGSMVLLRPSLEVSH